jgi:hypothetical protein
MLELIDDLPPIFNAKIYAERYLDLAHMNSEQLC